MKEITIEFIISELGQIPLCKCGCGHKINIKLGYHNYLSYKKKGYPKFIRNHDKKDKPKTDVQKEKISKSRKGKCCGLDNPMSRPEVRAKQLESTNTKEFKERRSELTRGGNHPLFNKHHTPESIEKNRLAHIDKKMSQSTKDLQSSQRKGIPKSESHKKKIGKSNEEYFKLHPEKYLRGKEHPNYIIPEYRITPLHSQIRNCLEYSNWRTQVFGRDNFTCQECGVRGTWLEAHHLKQFSDILKENNITNFEEALLCSELWDISNGKTLCEECHKNISTRR